MVVFLVFIVIFIPVSIPCNLTSQLAWASRDGKIDGTLESVTRFDRVESVTTARAYHENFTQVYREFLEENRAVRWTAAS